MITKDDTARYFETWDALEPHLADLLHTCDSMLRQAYSDLKITSTAIRQGGDEEFKLSLEWHMNNDDASIIGCDIILADALARGEEEAGFNVKLDLIGSGGEHHLSYVPNNFREDVFTLEVDELEARVNQIKSELPMIVDHIGCHLLSYKGPTPNQIRNRP